MSDIKISIVASSIRPHLWENIAESLLSNIIEYEVIMVGPNPGKVPLRFKHILTNVKPAQCYEIGFRNATGDLITWSTDDACYSPQALDNAYNYWKSFNNEKLVVAINTIEDGNIDNGGHRFFNWDRTSPRMAPYGLMSRKLLIDFGGYDRRFICGQAENDVVMRVYEIGGIVEVCPSHIYVVVDHEGVHSSGTVFRSNYYEHGRAVLEELWVKNDQLSQNRLSPVDRFSEDNILTETQGPKGDW